MIAFKDCEYSLFISYSHSDDAAANYWVQSLRTAILRRLELLDNDIPKLGLHFSQENGPSSGSLASALQGRVAKSFGMLLVVGEKYVQSRYCEDELRYFAEAFGAAGTRGRLYIVAMSEAALKAAQDGEQWKKLMPGTDQLWVPMFQSTQRNKPLQHKMAPGESGFPPEFFDQVIKLVDPLMVEITRDYEASKQLVRQQVTRAPNTGITAPARPGQSKQITIGPHTPSLAAAVQGIRLALENAGAQVTVLGRSEIDDCDPDDGRPLRPLLAIADVLVVPATLESPMKPDTDGGHTAILKREWLAAGKAEKDLVWYRPADVVVAPEHVAKERHQKFFNELAPVCFNETALVSHLFGIGNVPAIRVHIENHPKERAFRRLSRQLEDAWNALPPDPLRPMLRCVALDLDDLANAPKDVAGVVLLLPVPLKDQKSLMAQIDLVQRLIPQRGAAYPGCVAVLYDPPLDPPVSPREWTYVQIKKSPLEPMLTIEDDSKSELQEFLYDLWDRYRRSQPALVTAPTAP